METIDMTGFHGGGGQPVKQAPVVIYRNVIPDLIRNLSMQIKTDSGSGAGVTMATGRHIPNPVTLTKVRVYQCRLIQYVTLNLFQNLKIKK